MRKRKKRAAGPDPTDDAWYRPPQDAHCGLCGRRVPAQQQDLHHLVPKSKGGKVTVVLHRICHRQIHALFTETELATTYATIDRLLLDEEVRHFVKWVRTKPEGFHERTRTSNRKRR